MRFCLLIIIGTFLMDCAGFARSDKSPDQIAAERSLLNRKTALLERENQVLRDENLELTRSGELAKADFEKKQAELRANDEQRAAQLKTAEAAIKNLSEKIGILESESGGKIKQLTALNAELAEKHAQVLEKLQTELRATQLEAAKDKEKLNREAAEKQFTQGKELQELKQRIAEKEKEVDELRRKTAELRESETRLHGEINELKKRTPPAPAAP